MRDLLSRFRGPFTRSGLAAALTICLLDQASKLWLLYGFDLPARGRVALGPVVELVLVRNYGISYGWFQWLGASARWALVAVTALAVVLLAAWLARVASRLSATALGLIIGGALGNAIDRLAQNGAVVDFIRLHVAVAGVDHDWYVFNLADAAIVAGVAGLLYESVRPDRAAKVP
ncbi:MAG TPA: signal peptidase II [Xanthobacteraceae bacterium]|nr:signal peptidase II [Xanthobacteraceae bacterium]